MSTVSSPALPLIQVENLNFSLSSLSGKVDILKNINFQVDEHETIAIVGASGSGKTSLLMLLAGLERPTQGLIHIHQHDLSLLDEDGLAIFRRDHIGIVFQNFHLVSTMTALENVALPLELAINNDGSQNKFDMAKVILERIGLGHRLHH